MFEKSVHGLESLEQLELQADAVREQQSKWMQSGSSSRSGCSWGATAEADANEEQKLKRIDAIGELQLKQTQLGSHS